jgi:hypothetical protein
VEQSKNEHWRGFPGLFGLKGAPMLEFFAARQNA